MPPTSPPQRSLRRCLIALAALAASSLHGADKDIVIKPAGPLGPYSIAQWKQDWPGCEWEDGVKEGHLSLVEREGKNALRVDYAMGQIGPEKGGCGWRDADRRATRQ